MLTHAMRAALLITLTCFVGAAVEVVDDWRLVPGTPPTRQKQIIVTACTWWPGRDVRLPVVLVAPAEGGPFPFVISSIA